MSKNKNNGKRFSFKDITKENVSMFIQGNVRMFAHQLGGTKRFPLLAKHLQEQVVYRSSKCQDCIEQGKCVSCGCTIPGKFYATKACSGNRWGDILSKEKWEEFKEKNNINIDIKE